jgi:hypothetical protein
MATLRETVRTRLETNAALMAEFTGGVFDRDEVFREGAAPNAPRDPADGITLLPFICIGWQPSTALQGEIPKLRAERETVEIYFYDDVGYARIERGIGLVKDDLHDQYLSANDRGIAHFQYTYTSGEVSAQELGGAPSRFSRYIATTVR